MSQTSDNSNSQASVASTSSVDEIIEINEDENGRKRRKLEEEINKRPIPNFGKLQSKVYSQFKWLEDLRQWKCRHCSGGQYNHSTRGGSASLSTHLNSRHPSIAKQHGVFSDNDRRSVTEFYKPAPKKIPPPITEEGFKNVLVNFIVMTDQPFSLVEAPSFIEYTQYLSQENEKTKLPKRDAMKTYIGERFIAERTKLMTALQHNTSKIGFIIDGCTSSNQKPFQGVIGTWINEKWSLCQTVLDLSILTGEHTGIAIAESFAKVLDDFDLWNKLIAVTSDNASNLDTMFRKLDELAEEKMIDFNSSDNRVRCLAHIINLACKAIIDHVLMKTRADCEDFEVNLENEEEPDFQEAQTEAFLLTLRRAIRAIRGSTQRRELFEKCCTKANMKPNILILDVATRWNSTVAMLRRVLNYKKPFLATMNLDKNLKKLNLTDDSEMWGKVEQLIELLQPFEEATNMLSQGHSPTLPDTATVFLFLFNKLEKYTDGKDDKLLSTRARTRVQNKYPEWLVESAKEGWKKLQKYYKYNDDLVHVVATVMDPRCKLNWFKISWKKPFVEAVRRKVTNLWTSKYRTVADDTAEENCTTEATNNIADFFSEQMQEFYRSDDELKRYLNEPVVNFKTVPVGVQGALSWWKLHESMYPQLSKMARDFLAVSATGVPVERLFSAGSDLLSPRRQRLTGASIQLSMCLKQWLKSENILYSIEDFKDAVLDKLGIDLDEPEEDPTV